MLKYILILFCFVQGVAQESEPIKCIINTEIGEISLELYPDKAPITVANFLRYVEAKKFDKTTFFRVTTPENEAEREIKIEVIQGGVSSRENSFAPIPLETTQQTGLNHEDGTISMARSEPDTATGSFFICIGDQPSLDFEGKRNPDGQGFAAFGKVISGMEVVKKIQHMDNKGQRLLKPVVIQEVRKLN